MADTWNAGAYTQMVVGASELFILLYNHSGMGGQANTVDDNSMECGHGALMNGVIKVLLK